MRLLGVAICLCLSGCGAAYITPTVDTRDTGGANVRVLPMTPETVLLANRSTYRPQRLPAAFSSVAGVSNSALGAGALPDPALQPQTRPGALETRLPPQVIQSPYRIGVGDVILLATPQGGSSVEELSGLLAAQNRRQGYTVRDDGAIAIPDLGPIQVAGMTLEEAEDMVFQALVANQIDPTFSLEVAEFNSKRVSVGGAVQNPGVAPITLTPLFLDEALAQAGGVTVADQDFATVRIYREGTLYQVPVSEVYSRGGLRRIQLIDGDSVFVDTEFDLGQAERYFQEQIRLAEFRQTARSQALSQLETEFSIRRAALQDQRSNFKDRVEFGAVKRDYVYLAGEVTTQSRFPLPFNQKAVLADALYSEGGVPTETGNPGQIYVLRGSPNPADFASLTAYHLDASNAVNLLVATRMELRPNDVIFVAEQPITRWNRVLQQFVPSLITASIAAATNNN